MKKKKRLRMYVVRAITSLKGIGRKALSKKYKDRPRERAVATILARNLEEAEEELENMIRRKVIPKNSFLVEFMENNKWVE